VQCSKCRFSLYLNSCGLEKVLENFSWGSWKVLDFFVSKRVGTLSGVVVVVVVAVAVVVVVIVVVIVAVVVVMVIAAAAAAHS